MKELAQSLILSLRGLPKELIRQVVKELQPIRRKLTSDLRKRTGYAFQTVPSYLYESRRGYPGRKKYPEGTVATFATSSQSLAGSAWEGQVQKYISGTHALRDQLKVEISKENTDVIVEAGYEDSVSDSHPEISRVIFGTTKMQARPFLQLALLAREKDFMRAMERAATKVLR